MEEKVHYILPCSSLSSKISQQPNIDVIEFSEAVSDIHLTDAQPNRRHVFLLMGLDTLQSRLYLTMDQTVPHQ